MILPVFKLWSRSFSINFNVQDDQWNCFPLFMLFDISGIVCFPIKLVRFPNEPICFFVRWVDSIVLWFRFLTFLSLRYRVRFQPGPSMYGVSVVDTLLWALLACTACWLNQMNRKPWLRVKRVAMLVVVGKTRMWKNLKIARDGVFWRFQRFLKNTYCVFPTIAKAENNIFGLGNTKRWSWLFVFVTLQNLKTLTAERIAISNVTYILWIFCPWNPLIVMLSEALLGNLIANWQLFCPTLA